MAKKRLFTDVVIAGLIAAASTAPIAGYSAYNNHIEQMEKLADERAQHVESSVLAREHEAQDARHALCADSLQYLEDERTNPALPAEEQQLLIEDLRRNASACTIEPRAEAASPGSAPRVTEKAGTP